MKKREIKIGLSYEQRELFKSTLDIKDDKALFEMIWELGIDEIKHISNVRLLDTMNKKEETESEKIEVKEELKDKMNSKNKSKDEENKKEVDEMDLEVKDEKGEEESSEVFDELFNLD